MNLQLDQIFSFCSHRETNQPIKRVLFYGIGNIGRQDDGLGIRLIEYFQKRVLPECIELQANYQLNIEDALEISNFDIVIFVDASIEPNAKTPFEIRELLPSAEIAFCTHAMAMTEVLALCYKLYNKMPKAFVLTLPGYHWNIIDELSEQASANFGLVTQLLEAWLASLQPNLNIGTNPTSS